MNTIVIRPIQKQDNAQIAAVIRKVLIELNVPKVGTAYADPQLDSMFETYDHPRAIYYVIENNGIIVGGCGVSQLENESESICELQKMYFLPEVRGLGLGVQMIQKCLQSAQEFGFKKCYLETMPYMEAAQQLYKKVGFDYICAPMGNTGHVSCPVWMLKEL
ncbi:GNAT family N-acetyltransferase [Flavobacterium sp.]|uniref:GNAT family N-acetyltransferase n=1 Tax=Flavobacterium sp. TaxID=239 RepID=UPI00286C27C6|nr:GNAT family N-acetyltransferase [Flavobacterium sp.]